MLAGHVQVAADLIGLQSRRGRLDLNETSPGRLPALGDERPVRDMNLARRVLKLDLGVREEAPLRRS